MSLKTKVETDLKDALKKRESEVVSVLRFLLSEIQNMEIKDRKVLTDEEVLTVLTKSLKRHQDSITQFREGGRDDLAQKEEREVKILEVYMPEAMPTEELEQIVKDAVASAKNNNDTNMGSVMKILMPKIKGRASGQIVSDLVKKELAKP